MALPYDTPTIYRNDSASYFDPDWELRAINPSQAPRNGLDLKAMGVYCGNSLDEVECTLVHYKQVEPGGPLHMGLLRVRDFV